MKLLGSIFVMSGGGLLWYKHMARRKRRRETLSDLLAALRRMGEEIRMARPPLPWLLERLAKDCGPEAEAFLQSGAEALRQGRPLGEHWQRRAEKLPLSGEERRILTTLGYELRGDEETVCGAIRLAMAELEREKERWEAQRLGEEKQLTAVCFSGAALLVILLI